jgi:hypothetical protein
LAVLDAQLFQNRTKQKKRNHFEIFFSVINLELSTAYFC